MNEKPIQRQELFNTLPPEWPRDLLPEIQRKVAASGRKLVVLDDDPTGTQTVHAIPVLTHWSVAELCKALREPTPAFYLLTNSRSLPPSQAEALSKETGQRLLAASQQSGKNFVVASRSDSTLRGHFPNEVAALADGLGNAQQPFDAWLVIPFFPEGGRYTVNDIHYVAEGDQLMPAGQTEFARDKAFGYQSSNLKEWVTEKTGGKVPTEQVNAITLEDLRIGGPRQVQQKLLSFPKGTICVVNAASYRDLEVLVAGLLDAESQGRRYLYRCAASFVRVRAGLTPRSLLTLPDLHLPTAGAGLVVVGSYVPKTTVQLETLMNQTSIAPVEIQVQRLLDDNLRDSEIARAAQTLNTLLDQGNDTVLFTSRVLVSGEGIEANLAIGRSVSDSLVAIVQRLAVRPRYLLAKGGITSSDIATQGLGIHRALVLGQILPGVPVWQTGAESRFPGLAYIVFPGNVGGKDALAQVVNSLRMEA